MRSIIARLREANRLYDRGEITWEERVARHNEIVPDIGDLGEQAGKRRQESGKSQRRDK